MTTHRDDAGETFRLPDITRADRAHFVKQARRLRAEQIDRLLLAAGRSLARIWRFELPNTKGRLPSGTIS